MTDGLLVARAYRNRRFMGYHTVIIDESHECNANIYLILALVRRAVKERSKSSAELKVIIMSAAINVDKFIRYFEGYGKVGAMHIPAATHSVDLRYLGETPRTQERSGTWSQTNVQPQASDIVEESCRIVASIVRGNMAPGSILVFMPGVPEAEKACRRMKQTIEGV